MCSVEGPNPNGGSDEYSLLVDNFEDPSVGIATDVLQTSPIFDLIFYQNSTRAW